MGPVEAITTCLRKSFHFSGRATRSEFWWFALFTMIAVWASGAIDRAVWPDMAFSGWVSLGDRTNGLVFGQTLSPLSSLVTLMTAVPGLAVTSRRLHDVGLSGALALLPLAGIAAACLIAVLAMTLFAQAASGTPILIIALILAATLIFPLIWLVGRSQPGHNRYGPNPIEVTP